MKKLLKRVNVVQLFLDLVIVFIGVSLAFLFTNYQEEKREEKQTEQILSLLYIGLERYEQLFEGHVLYHEKYNVEFSDRLNNDDIPNIEGITYSSPAYPIDAITLLTDKGYEMLGSTIYVNLTAFSNAIRRLMYVDQKLVSISEKSMEMNRSDFSVPMEYQLELKKWARKYLQYLEIRKNTLKELLNKSHNLRALLEEVYPAMVID